MRSDNLGRWVDELAATIEDLEKRVAKIQATPAPEPSNTIIIEDFGTENVIANMDLPDGKELTDYDYFNISIQDAEGSVIACGLIQNLFDSEHVGSQYFYFGNVTFTFTLVLVPGYETQLGVIQVTSEDITDATYTVQGINYLVPDTRSRSFLKKAADAVKKILGKEDK